MSRVRLGRCLRVSGHEHTLFFFPTVKFWRRWQRFLGYLAGRAGTAPECHASGASFRSLDRRSMPGNGGFFAGPLTGIGPDRGRPYPARRLTGAGNLRCRSFRLVAEAPFPNPGRNGENDRKWRKMVEKRGCALSERSSREHQESSRSAWLLATSPALRKNEGGVSRTWHSRASDADAIDIEALPPCGTVWHGGRLPQEASHATSSHACQDET
jgi:hypothetical protein